MFVVVSFVHSLLKSYSSLYLRNIFPAWHGPGVVFAGSENQYTLANELSRERAAEATAAAAAALLLLG